MHNSTVIPSLLLNVLTFYRYSYRLPLIALTRCHNTFTELFMCMRMVQPANQMGLDNLTQENINLR
jgi:hypothetical protein